jgi:hypothetical protein
MISALEASASSAGLLGVQIWTGKAGPGKAGLSKAGHGEAWQGLRQQHWELRLPLLLSLRADKVQHVGERRGQARLGRARSGEARPSKDCRQQYGGSGLPTVLSGTGMVRPAEDRSGEDWRG